MQAPGTPCDTEATPSSPLEIHWRPLGEDEYEVTAAGSLDASTVSGLRDCLDDLVGRGCSCLVLDLNGVTFADAASLGLLVRTRERLRARQGVVRVAYRDSPYVLRLMQITKLDRLFA